MLRFAASPTSDMSIDSLRVALYNYIVSQQKGEDFIVRIEDTDKEKNIEAKDQEILDLLTLFGIQYSQVIYQSQNLKFYTAMALQLIHDKKAFSCFCSPAWLENKAQEAKKNKQPYRYDDACANLPHELVIDNTNPFTIRIKKPIKNKDMDSFVIMRQDKTPTNNFSCAVDDMLNDISLVVHTQENRGDTLKQEHIRTSLNYDKKIHYTHLPNILGSDNAPSVKYLLEEGFLPESISNYLISISSKPPQEVFGLQDAIQWLDLEKISKSPTHFNIDTLREINRKHLLSLDAKELSRYVGFADEEVGNLARIYLKELFTTKELKEKITTIFSHKEIPLEFKKQSDLIAQSIKKAPYFENYDDFKNHIMQEVGLKDEEFLKPFRYVLTGASQGPDIAEIYRYLKNYIAEIVK